METIISSTMIKLFVFDMDGTLYDLHGIMRNVYAMQVEFLRGKLHTDRAYAETMLREHNIYPEMRKDSRSATEYFHSIGIDKKEWMRYREENYDVGWIDAGKAVRNEILQLFARIAPLALVSSNTEDIIIKALAHVGIDRALFQRIISSDAACIEGGFNKRKAFSCLLSEGGFLSVGDRYATDIQPALELGQSGVLVHSPEGVCELLRDIRGTGIGSSVLYQYYSAQSHCMI